MIYCVDFEMRDLGKNLKDRFCQRARISSEHALSSDLAKPNG